MTVVRAACFYRIRLPLEELAKHDGFQVSMRNMGDQEGLPPPLTLRDMTADPDGNPFDIIIGQRFNHHAGLETWRKARGPFNRLVYEIDDDVFSVNAENWAAFHLYGRKDVQDAIIHSAEVADLVTVTCEPLAEVFREKTDGAANVKVLPNFLPGWLPDLPRPPLPRPAVGWAGGASHGADIGLVAEPVRRFLKRFPGWDLRLAGTDYRPTFKVDKDRTRFTPWIMVNKDPEGYFRILDYDIALAPVYDCQFARSKCVDSSMRICTDKGVIEAGMLEPGMRVWHEGWRAIEAVVHDVPRPGVLLTMESGYQLRLTPEHRMAVNSTWMQAGRIRPGDQMVMEREWPGPQRPVRIPWPADSRMSRAGDPRCRAATREADERFDPNAFLTATDGPYLDITPRWGRILGAFAGDGNVGQATQLQISCDGQDQDWIDLLMDDFRACGFNPTTEQITTFNGTPIRRRRVRIASAHLLRVFASLGITRARPSGNPIRVPSVPEIIWRSPRDVITEFLAAYFEADGGNNSSGIRATSKDELLIRDVQRLLLLYGITSTVKSHNNSAQNGFTGTYWSCVLRRAEADVFAKEIGFRSERKRNRLAEITSRPHNNAYKPMSWGREVISVEPCMVTPVDIQVEDHVFALAGFTSHNSALKIFEHWARGIPVLASDVEPYRGVISDGVDGFTIRRDHEWLSRLSELASDDSLREKMSTAARESSRKHLITDGWRMWADAYQDLFR